MVSVLGQRRLRANFGLNVIGALLPAVIALVTVPMYVSYIGVARYGVLSIIWVLLGYFGFLDFGLSQASTNALAKIAHSSEGWIRVFVTSFYLNLVLGGVGGLALYYIGKVLVHRWLPVGGAIGVELEEAFRWIACLLPLAMLAGLARGAMESRERFFVINVLELIGTVLGQILPILAAIFIGPSLTVVIPAVLLARALSLGLNLASVATLERIKSLRGFDRRQLNELFGYGAWVSVTNVLSPLLTSSDQLLVGSALGAAAVAHYAVPMNLVIRSQVIAAALARALFPRFARLGAQEAINLAEKAVVPLAYSFGAICGAAILVSGPFMAFWMGKEFAATATPVLELLLVGAWANGIAFVPYSFLHGRGRPDLVAKLHALEFIPFIALLWFLLHRFGLAGAALAWSGRVASDAALLFAAARFSTQTVLNLFPALILLLACYVVTQVSSASVMWSALGGCASVLAFAGCAAVFDTTSRQVLRALAGYLVTRATR
jgi:O-antigen/teichoic acid export membrane protein